MLDLLWAEAARLEDLPPSDLIDAANLKETTGKKNRKRLFDECKRINRSILPTQAFCLSQYLLHGEYKKFCFSRGLKKVE